VLQSSLLDGVAFDPFSLQEDGPVSAEVDVGGRQVLEAFVVAPVIVVLDEARDLGFEIASQVIFSSRMRFLSVWCQRSILPWVCGWHGAPRTCTMPRSFSHSVDRWKRNSIRCR
jgi:hypothetical protein